MQLGQIIRFKKDGIIAMITGIDSKKPKARKVTDEDGYTYWTTIQKITDYCDIINFSS